MTRAEDLVEDMARVAAALPPIPRRRQPWRLYAGILFLFGADLAVVWQSQATEYDKVVVSIGLAVLTTVAVIGHLLATRYYNAWGDACEFARDAIDQVIGILTTIATHAGKRGGES